MLLQIIRIKNDYNWILFQILSCNGVLWPDWARAAGGEPMRRGLSLWIGETKRRPPIRAGSPVACLVRKKRR